jgi:hypothetical protein
LYIQGYEEFKIRMISKEFWYSSGSRRQEKCKRNRKRKREDEREKKKEKETKVCFKLSQVER